jgi:hypothetical protein
MKQFKLPMKCGLCRAELSLKYTVPLWLIWLAESYPFQLQLRYAENMAI